VAPTALNALQRVNILTIQRGEAIFPETLPVFFLCSGTMNTNERPQNDFLNNEEPTKAKTKKGN
jgi:hypothetical protein